MNLNFLTLISSGFAFAFTIAIMTAAGVMTVTAQTPFRVTICHRTGSASNPYVQMSPDVETVVKGHMDHDQAGNGLGGDIIPVFTFGGCTYSKNLDTVFGNCITGAMLLATGCRIWAPAPAQTSTPTPHMTPTPQKTPTSQMSPKPTPQTTPMPTPQMTTTPGPPPNPESGPTMPLLLAGGLLLLGFGVFAFRRSVIRRG